MNSKVYLITPLAKHIPVDRQADYIGVDAGFLKVQQAGLECKWIIGDFDSLAGDLPGGADGSVEIHQVKKNETDTELAVLKAVSSGYKSIIVWGGLSHRLDHTIANLRLMMYRFPQVVLQDELQKAQVLQTGKHDFSDDYKHISFFAIEPSVIRLGGFEYNTGQIELKPEDIFTTSNSVPDGGCGTCEVFAGRVLCIQSSFR